MSFLLGVWDFPFPLFDVLIITSKQIFVNRVLGEFENIFLFTRAWSTVLCVPKRRFCAIFNRFAVSTRVFRLFTAVYRQKRLVSALAALSAAARSAHAFAGAPLSPCAASKSAAILADSPSSQLRS